MQTLSRSESKRQHQALTLEPDTWPESAVRDVKTRPQAVQSVWFGDQATQEPDNDQYDHSLFDGLKPLSISRVIHISSKRSVDAPR